MPPKSCYAILSKDESNNILKVFQEITDEYSLKQQLVDWLSLDFNNDLILGDKDDEKTNCYLVELKF